MARYDAGGGFDDFEEQPKAATSIFTIILAVLNVLAVGAFAYFLLLDYEARQKWSYNVFLHDLAILGLPLASEESGFSASRATAPKQVLSPEMVRAAFTKRGGSVPEPFLAVDEPIPPRIKPQEMSDEIVATIFRGDPFGPVKTLDEEVARVKGKLFGDIAQAAQEAAAPIKADDARRDMLRKLLLPMAVNVQQVQKLDKAINGAKASDLGSMLEMAYQRRMLIDLFMPLEYARAGNYEMTWTEKLGDLKGFKNDEIEAQITMRLDQAVSDKFNPAVHQGKDWDQVDRDSIAKRRSVAYLLFAIANLQKPDGTPLYPKGLDRAQTVVGLYEYSLAAQAYTKAMAGWGSRVFDLIADDREGSQVVVKGEPVRTPGFVDQYPELVENLRNLVREIQKADFRLKDLEDQRNRAQTYLAERQKHLAKVSDELLVERERTSKMLGLMFSLESSFYEALVVLRDAHEANLKLERQIREAEGIRPRVTPPGGKTP